MNSKTWWAFWSGEKVNGTGVLALAYAGHIMVLPLEFLDGVNPQEGNRDLLIPMNLHI